MRLWVLVFLIAGCASPPADLPEFAVGHDALTAIAGDDVSWKDVEIRLEEVLHSCEATLLKDGESYALEGSRFPVAASLATGDKIEVLRDHHCTVTILVHGTQVGSWRFTG